MPKGARLAITLFCRGLGGLMPRANCRCFGIFRSLSLSGITIDSLRAAEWCSNISACGALHGLSGY